MAARPLPHARARAHLLDRPKQVLIRVELDEVVDGDTNLCREHVERLDRRVRVERRKVGAEETLDAGRGHGGR